MCVTQRKTGGKPEENRRKSGGKHFENSLKKSIKKQDQNRAKKKNFANFNGDPNFINEEETN